jgi:hypothetical protein
MSADVDVCIDRHAERDQVEARLNASALQGSSASNTIWVDRDKARTIVLLQDRVSQVGVFAEQYQTTLTSLHKLLFPDTEQPADMSILMERFRDGRAVYKFAMGFCLTV